MNKLKSHMLTCLLALILSTAAFPVTAFAGGPDYEEPVEETLTETEPGEPLSEDSDISTRDLLFDKATNKQFITITDRDGNVFYLVIDYDSPVSEDEEQYKTYFLNPVDTDDLAALAEESETKPAACTCTERCVADMTACAGKETEPEKPQEPAPVEEPEKPETSGGLNPAVLLLLIALLAGGGVFLYMKFVKNKPKTKGNTNLDDYDYGDEEDDAEDALWESEEETTESREPDQTDETDEEPVG